LNGGRIVPATWQVEREALGEGGEKRRGRPASGIVLPWTECGPVMKYHRLARFRPMRA